LTLLAFLMVSIGDVEEAHKRIKSLINRTPVHTSTTLNSVLDAEVFVKCENFQKAGAFKSRGASNAVFSLSESEIVQGHLWKMALCVSSTSTALTLRAPCPGRLRCVTKR